MQSHLLFRNIPDSLSHEILEFLRTDERDMYKTALATLAAQRKLRPVFVQRKPVPKQISWLKETLQLRTSDGVAEHIFQIWFLKAKAEMLVTFLDELGIEHDGEGSVEGSLPETMEDEKLKTTLDDLVSKHDPKLVTLYLRIFNLQTKDGWANIEALLESDERLALA